MDSAVDWKKKHNVGVVSWNCQLQIGAYQEHWQQPVLCNSGEETVFCTQEPHKVLKVKSES